MFILKKGHQPGVYVPLRALFLVTLVSETALFSKQEMDVLIICYPGCNPGCRNVLSPTQS